MKRRIQMLFALLFALVLVVQLPVLSHAEAAEEIEEEAEYEFYEMEDYSFQVDASWDVEEDEQEYLSRIIFTADDGFSIHVALIREENQSDLDELMAEALADVPPEAQDYAHQRCCFLCGLDCPSGEGQKAGFFNYVPETDEAVIFYVYDSERYVKGCGFYSDNENTLVIAADCTDAAPSDDAALMRMIASVTSEDDLDIEEETEEEDELDRKYLWGESQDAVEEAEGEADSYIGERGDPECELIYFREIQDEEWLLFYSFDEDGLYEAKYAFLNSGAEELPDYAEHAWNLYTDVCDSLVAKFGEPDAERESWTDESLKEEYTEAEALAEGLMYSIKYWELDDCTFKINIFEDGGDILLLIDIIAAGR